MQFHVGKIHLCRGCVFTFTRLVVANVRQGIGAAYDVFVGDKGSIVVAVNAVRWVLVIAQRTFNLLQLHVSKTASALHTCMHRFCFPASKGSLPVVDARA